MSKLKTTIEHEFDRLNQEINSLKNKCERLRQEAEFHAMEARTQRATVNEIYQVCTGATGEPGDWNGKVPVEKALINLQTRTLDNLAKEFPVELRKMWSGEEVKQWIQSKAKEKKDEF